MIETVQGIVIKTVKFSDTKLVVDMFTLGHGRQSFVTTITHPRKGRSQMAFWSPLSMVEFQADMRPASSALPKPKDVRLYYNYFDVCLNPLKSTVALFLAEFLSAALKEEGANVPLYRYLETSFQFFDQMDSSASIANFHLVFLLRLSRFLGILPNLELDTSMAGGRMPLFDLVSSTYIYGYPSHGHYLEPEEACVLPLLFRLNFSTMHLLRLTRAQRMRCLELINLYYRLHIPYFPELKSIDVLHEIFS